MGDLAATDIRRLLSSLRLARACPQPGAAPRGDRRPRRESGLLVPEQPERGDAALFGEVERVAPVDVPILTAGESGTGKELVANAIQRSSARREQAPPRSASGRAAGARGRRRGRRRSRWSAQGAPRAGVSGRRGRPEAGRWGARRARRGSGYARVALQHA
jgi:hypothetical protein